MHTLPLLPTAVIFHCFRHAVTLSHHRTASSPRRLSRYSDHAAVARLQLYHTAAAGATATSPLSLPKPLLLVPPAPSSLAPVNNKRPGPAAATSPTAATPATATPPLRPRRRLATPAAAARQTLRPKGEGGGCRPPQSLMGGRPRAFDDQQRHSKDGTSQPTPVGKAGFEVWVGGFSVLCHLSLGVNRLPIDTDIWMRHAGPSTAQGSLCALARFLACHTNFVRPGRTGVREDGSNGSGA